MDVAMINGATHCPGAPANWTPENGPCGALPIIYRKDSHGNPECVSAWRPTADELRMLNEGPRSMTTMADRLIEENARLRSALHELTLRCFSGSDVRLLCIGVNGKMMTDGSAEGLAVIARCELADKALDSARKALSQ